MMLRDSRSPQGRDMGPSTTGGLKGSVRGAFGGVEPRDFRHRSAISQGLCPVCGVKMQFSNQRSCLKVPKGMSSWDSMRRRGRGGYRYGKSRKTA